MANSQAIDHVLSRAVYAQDVPGVVAMAATDQGVMYEGAFGTRELGKDVAMTPDTVVWVASMTKAITAAAAMQLVERGKLHLDAPATDVVPELAKAQVLEGFERTKAGGLSATTPLCATWDAQHLVQDFPVAAGAAGKRACAWAG
jgi:methyl acetate hydrolase